MARKSHPAKSLNPSDRANYPFMAMPTPARGEGGGQQQDPGNAP
jgi:hypothetical protein